MHEHAEEYENGDLSEPLKKATMLKYRDIIAETCSEFSRRNNYVRIYPARGSKQYDKFFTSSKALNKIVYKTLFGNEVLPHHSSKDESNIKERKRSTILPPASEETRIESKV
jgi:hypothetical protein